MTETMQDTTIETATTETTLVVPQQEPSLPPALGARRIAGLLADHTGEPVTAADVDDLVAQEHMKAVDHSLLDQRVDTARLTGGARGVAGVLGTRAAIDTSGSDARTRGDGGPVRP
ncbi:hypothetical protein JJV70_15760 [Streptomyces sp. JJ66]|uniref:hypothetical protein n=1 Tax=Streptomyces sp. JJ66 TaxID=2803843 RepID=UPI001C55AF74|nr:hypothetical protein [Streptomyces sp. JJ66]MBW1603534.1 hypothetical protein [Streptomyces sp. JJ66]